jgi:hypothetical protein
MYGFPEKIHIIVYIDKSENPVKSLLGNEYISIQDFQKKNAHLYRPTEIKAPFFESDIFVIIVIDQLYSAGLRAG